MRIDLLSNRVAVLRIHGMVDSQHDLVAVANKLVPYGHGGDNHFVAVGGYRKSGTAHRLSVEVHPHNNRQHLELVYECPAVQGESLHDPPRSVLRTTTQLESLFSSEPFTEISSDFHCDVRFHHTSTEVSTLIPLPMLTVDDPALPFSAVTGVRFDKYVEDSSEYSVSITRSKSRDALISNIQFHSEGTPTINLPRDCMSTAVKIAHRFVSLRGSTHATS